MTRRDTHAIGRAFAWLAARTGRSVAAAAALAVVSVCGLAQPAPDRVTETGPAWQEARRARAQFGRDDAALVALLDRGEGGASGERIEAAARAVERALEALPWVAEVVTPWDLPGGRERTLEDLFERAPEVVGAALSPGRGLLVPVRLSGASAPPEAAWDVVLREAAVRAMREAGAADVEPVVTGLPALIEAQGRAFAGERVKFMVGGVLLGFLLSSLAFRTVRGTFLAGLPPIFGLAVSVGAARLLGLGSDGFTSIVLPLLVLTIGYTDSLHVVVEAARRRASSEDAAEAMGRAVGELALPCALTSLTTAIGFGSMAASGHAIIVDFGLSCAVATGLTFASVLVTLPLLARTPLGRALEDVGAKRARGARRRRGLPEFVDRSVAWTLARPRAVAATGAAATAALALVFFGLEADRTAAVDLSQDSAAARGLLRVDGELGGVFPVAVRVDWGEGVDEEAALAATGFVRDVLDAEPLFAGAVGPLGVARALTASLGGTASSVRPAAAGALLRAVPADARRAFVDLDGRSALVRARMPDAGAAASLRAVARVERAIADLGLPAGVEARVVGEHVAFLRSLQGVAGDMRWSLALAAVLIVITLSLAFRSVRMGAASVVPNLLPIGASAGGMAALGVPLDISALTALTLSLGIATDDTIHVLFRWVRARELRPDGGAARAARGAVARTLPALTLTTVALTAAFGQLLTSSIPTIRTFGIVAATTLVVALIADVLVLPAILVALPGRKGARP